LSEFAFVLSCVNMVRFEVHVCEAMNLPAAYACGTSDPYIEVCSSAERLKTDIKKKTLSPVFNEKKIVTVLYPQKDAIGFLVYDWDRVGANDLIAYSFISVARVPMNGMPIDCWIDLYKKGKKGESKAKKDAKKGKIPKPPTPAGRLHIIVRCLDVTAAPPMAMPPQPMPGAYPPQPMPGQPYPPQPMPGQPYPAQPMPGQPYPPQPMPGQPYPPQAYPPQPMPGQPYPPQPMPGQPYPPQPGYAPAPMAPMGVAPVVGAPMMNPLMLPTPYTGLPPCGFINKSGYLRPKKTDAEVAGHAAGKGAKKTLKVLGKILT